MYSLKRVAIYLHVDTFNLLQYIFKRLPQDCRVLDNEIVSTLKEPLEVSVQTRTRGTLCRLLSKTNFPDDAEGPSFFKDWMASMMNERGIMGGKGGDHVPEEAPVQAIRRYDDSQAGTRGVEKKKMRDCACVQPPLPATHPHKALTFLTLLRATVMFTFARLLAPRTSRVERKAAEISLLSIFPCIYCLEVKTAHHQKNIPSSECCFYLTEVQ